MWYYNLVSVSVMTLVVDSSAVMASVSTNTASSKQNTAIKLSWQANSTDTVKQNIASQKKSNDLDNYEVQWGDTLGTISVATGVSVNDLASRYGIPDANSIFAGVTLVHQRDFNSHVASITAVTSINRISGTNATIGTPDVNGTTITPDTPAVSESGATPNTPDVNGTTITPNTPVISGTSATPDTPVISGTSATSTTSAVSESSATPAVSGTTTAPSTPTKSSSSPKNSTSTNNSSKPTTNSSSDINYATPGSDKNPIDPDTGTAAPNGAYFDNDGWGR
ncbi:LysM peptidoglycan-binding domain-containing protein [Leuconostoc rapi]|uniref:LysM peptidoglycan-binding domain-containing protein n=1 Tax=Leuconostoc rapi TaxID=1406906 RepID=UPI001959FBF2|nr:LysM domain-containing protein [Leuconostoc rapi]MBM7434884.1 hypothetical protein [Leuconostoc rapi]